MTVNINELNNSDETVDIELLYNTFGKERVDAHFADMDKTIQLSGIKLQKLIDQENMNDNKRNYD